MGDRKLIEVEVGKFYYDPLDFLGIDFNDWSFVRKKRFDRIDRDKVDSLNHLGYLGREKWKKARDEKKTMDLRRWGYNG